MIEKTFKEYKKKVLKSSDLLKEYNELEPQYELIKELIKYRVDHNITQQQLANKTGIPKSNISRFESGKHSPSLKLLFKIAQGLGKEVIFQIK